MAAPPALCGRLVVIGSGILRMYIKYSMPVKRHLRVDVAMAEVSQGMFVVLRSTRWGS